MEFHVVVVQWRQRNVQKSLLHVQSCFSLIKTTFFAVLVAVNVIVAYFESSLILTVHGKWKRGPARAHDEAKKKNPFYLALPKMLRFNLKTVFFVVIQH